jgi:N-acetylmuramoyl-L-alanine amidase
MAKKSIAKKTTPKTTGMAGIIVGHHRQGDSGARAVDGTSEHAYNSVLAAMVAEELDRLGIGNFVWTNSTTPHYTAAVKQVNDEMVKRGATCAIELHFNAFSNPAANGYEYLHWHASPRGKELAGLLAARQGLAFPNRRIRRLIPMQTGNGAGFLRGVRPPAIITEPFFGTNPDEWREYNSEDGKQKLARAHAEAIALWHGVSV